MMHDWTADTDELADHIFGYVRTRIAEPKDTQWGAWPASELRARLGGSVCPQGIGGDAALSLFHDVILPACRPMDDPMNVAYVPTAPSPASTMFDLVVSSSSIFAGAWEGGAGAIAAENEALAWLAGLAGYPDGAGGVFVSGGSAANLSALVTARHAWRGAHPDDRRTLAFAATAEVHASVRASARVMDVDIVEVAGDDRGRMTGAALANALATTDRAVFAVVTSGGTTNAGVVDDLASVADVCDATGLWMHVDGAYGLAALCAPSVGHLFRGIDRSHSFGVDPHKWLFAPYDCAALVYRDPSTAAAAHAQHGDYLDAIDRNEWNPSDYAYHLSRRARGLPLWFGLATHGSDAYTEAVEATLDAVRACAADVRSRPELELLVEPDLSVLLVARRGWTAEQYHRWSHHRAKAGRFLVVPTKWHGQTCLRLCVVHPQATPGQLAIILDDLVSCDPSDLH